jgi:hypothetical protein
MNIHCILLISAISLAANSLAATELAKASKTALPEVAIRQSLGVDESVDYAALQDLAPWDDRNYQLRAKDIALLSEHESESKDLIPVFFRIELRKSNPNLSKKGPAQYPRSAFQRFKIKYQGYLINGKIYREVAADELGNLQVRLANGLSPARLKALLATEARVSGPLNGGAESAIAIKPTDVNRVIAGSNGPNAGQTMWFSSNGGTTWNLAGALAGANICCDPTVAWSTNGTVAYTATLGNGVYVYRSTDNGQTWGTNVVVPTTNDSVDKEYLHVDNAPTSPHIDRVYICWHLDNVQKFSRSLDQGVSFQTPITFASEPTGIGCDLSSDTSGNLYYVYPDFNTPAIRVLKSTNGGTSFAASVIAATTSASYDFPIPAMSVRRAFVYAATDVDLSNSAFKDSIYIAFTDSTAATTNVAANNHARIRVAFSRNGGATWTVRTPHETADSLTVDRFHPWLKVDQNGRVHVVYYDTRNSVSRTGVDFFYSYSDDGAATWSTPSRLTSINTPKPADSFEWGDYNGMDIALNKALGIFTDNRAEGGGGNTVDVYSAGDFAVTGALIETPLFKNGFE